MNFKKTGRTGNAQSTFTTYETTIDARVFQQLPVSRRQEREINMSSILIIDDDPLVRNMLSQFFAIEGYATIEASNGKEGLRMYREQQADLVVTDMIMPEMDGLETIQALRKENPDAKIIAISGGGRNSPGDYLVLADHFGANRTFAKPVERSKLLAAAQELLD